MYITIRVDCPMGHAIGVKEAIAMDLEKYGDVRIVRVAEDLPVQMDMEDEDF